LKKTKEIFALVKLLDDPDEFVYSNVKNKLISYGKGAIPFLEEFWEENSLDASYLDRIENLIHEIQFNIVFDDLKKWIESDDHDLLKGILILNKYQYPDLDEEPVIALIEKIKQDVWLEITNELTSFEKINVVNKILFEQYGFSGNKKNYHSPKNSFLNNVLETKKGNPLMLSAIYMLVTQDLGLPIYGVNLPSHFVLCYMDLDNINYYLTDNIEEKILVYINPFSKGVMMNHKEITHFLNQIKAPHEEKYFSPCENKDIIKRIISNLIYSYKKLGYQEKMEELQILKDTFNS